MEPGSSPGGEEATREKAIGFKENAGSAAVAEWRWPVPTVAEGTLH
jgi:hypothetical protein